MYIESLEVTNFRCFEHAKVQFEYAGRHAESKAPRLPNVNLILGDNGTGKSTILQAITLSVLGRNIQSSGFRPYFLVRRAAGENETGPSRRQENAAMQAKILLHPQDTDGSSSLWSDETTGSITGQATVTLMGDTETISSAVQVNPTRWTPLYDDYSPAFFLAAYGASRRVSGSESFDPAVRDKSRAPRYQRIAGLFEEAISLTPPNVCVNEFFLKSRLLDVFTLLNLQLPQVNVPRPKDIHAKTKPFNAGGWQTPTDIEYIVRGTILPFLALSDGYRGFVGWMLDLLYHMSRVTPEGRSLTELSGVVIVDELDLLLHPAWQRTVIETIATTFPRLQFFFTSHSPIVAGTLEAANLIITEVDDETGAVTMGKSRERVYGLSADQVLSSRYFGLASSRAQGAERQLRDLAERAMEDDSAAEEYLRLLADGTDGTAEAVPADSPKNGGRRAR